MNTTDSSDQVGELLELADYEIVCRRNFPKATVLLEVAGRMLRRKCAFRGINYESGKIINYVARLRYLFWLWKEVGKEVNTP